MTMVLESDTRGVDALYGDIVPQCPEVIWFQIVNELGPLPVAPHIDPFDSAPWRELPTVDELAYLWLESPINEIIHYMAIAAHGGGPDLPKFMAEQRFMAQIELDLKRERQAADAKAGGVDDCGAGGDETVGAAETGGGGGHVSGGHENGDEVGAGGAAVVDPDPGPASKVPRGRGPGKAQRKPRAVNASAVSAENP